MLTARRTHAQVPAGNAHHPHGLRRRRNLHALVVAFAGKVESSLPRNQPPLFLQTGVPWLAAEHDTRLRETISILQRCEVSLDMLDDAALEQRYPQVNFKEVARGLLEPESGVLLARRAVACVMEDALRHGAQFQIAHISSPLPQGNHNLDCVETSSGARISAGQFVFACGPWLSKVFPELLGQRIFPTRQEVFFFGTPVAALWPVTTLLLMPQRRPVEIDENRAI